jgi:hypothetical protein
MYKQEIGMYRENSLERNYLCVVLEIAYQGSQMKT